MSGSEAPPVADLLGTIVAAARRITAVRSEREPIGELAKRAEKRTPRPGVFTAALSRTDRWNIIAECKRRSPSRGVLRAQYDPVAIATAYEAAENSSVEFRPLARAVVHQIEAAKALVEASVSGLNGPPTAVHPVHQ